MRDLWGMRKMTNRFSGGMNWCIVGAHIQIPPTSLDAENARFAEPIARSAFCCCLHGFNPCGEGLVRFRALDEAKREFLSVAERGGVDFGS